MLSRGFIGDSLQLQLFIGCVYHNESTSRWPSCYFIVLHSLAPPCLNDLVRVADLPGRRRLRSSSSHQQLVPPFRLTTVGRRTFPVAASSATHCHLTSNHPRLCPSSVNVLKHSFRLNVTPGDREAVNI